MLGSTVVAATEGGSLYGLSLTTGAVLWRTHIADPIPLSALPCGDINPLGITGTPAYDAATGLVLAVAETAGGHHVLAGVRLDGTIAFQSHPRSVGRQHVRRRSSARRFSLPTAGCTSRSAGWPATAVRYIGQVVSVSSNGSGTPIGWAVPTSREGGIWAPGGPVADASGDIYVAAGNGASNSTYDGSDSVSKLSPTLARLDFFAPSTWADDNNNDLDLGSMSPVLVDGKVLGRRQAWHRVPARPGALRRCRRAAVATQCVQAVRRCGRVRRCCVPAVH